MIMLDFYPYFIQTKSKNIKRATWKGRPTKKVKTLKKLCDSIHYNYREHLPKGSKSYSIPTRESIMKSIKMQNGKPLI